MTANPAKNKYLSLGLITAIYTMSFVDRSVLSILNQAIKDDLGVSDTGMGFLGGAAFAVFYISAGIPIARIADAGSRRNVLSASLMFWSCMAFICALAANVWQLLLGRIGVAIGQAGGTPSSLSLISDTFPKNRLATAFGIYSLGIPAGSMIGYLLGGWSNVLFGWRTAFLMVGLTGLALAVAARLLLSEPERGGTETCDGNGRSLQVIRSLWHRKDIRFTCLAAGLHAMVFYGVSYWLPTLFFRVHGLDSMQMGTALFWIGLAGIAGTFLGGLVTDKAGVRDRRWYAWSPALTTILSVPFMIYCLVAKDPARALWVYAIPTFLQAAYLGPTFSLVQSSVPREMRATAGSLLIFALGLLGVGLGPQLAGILSDALAIAAPASGQSLAWALVLIAIVNVPCTILYLAVARELPESEQAD